jgi:predicted nucleotidyltransferase
VEACLEVRRRDVRRLLADVTDWARSRDDVDAVALVGSYARDQASMSSDVDVVVLTRAYADLADDVGWFLDLRPGSALIRSASWGPLLERRFRLTSGLVVELGLAPPTWARRPLDPGTRRVLRDGHQVLHDPHGLLRRSQKR